MKNLPDLPDWALLTGLSLVSILVPGWIALAPKPSGNVAVVFAPWTNGGEAIRRTTAAGSSVVRFGRFPFILVVHPTSEAFASRALINGALLVLNAEAGGGCLSGSGQST